MQFAGEFPLEMGGTLSDVEVAYCTFGERCDARGREKPVAWVCHALTADADVSDWWPGTVERGRFLDPEKTFTVCANILGSCYGTTGPTSPDPRTGRPYYAAFPRLTIRDMVRAHRLLADRLGIGRIDRLVGSSVGGFQAVEWAVEEPGRFRRLDLIATDAEAKPWTVALDETQRMALRADRTYGEPRPDAGRQGLMAARAIGLLSYRGASGYNLTQRNPDGLPLGELQRAQTYQHHQGEKLANRFDAYSYMAILDAFDTHDVGRGRGGLAAVLARIRAKTTVVGISTDIVFPPGEMRALAALIPGAAYHEITSPFGHDGFLVEADKLNAILSEDE